MNRRPLAVLGVAALAVTAVACSSSSSSAPTTTTVSGSSTTAADTSTSAPDTSTTAGTTTTTVDPTLDPLTGLPDADPNIRNRPALVVKINNHPDAWPQTGLNQADIVVEELVEGISRFAAVFHSQDSTPVGSIRSARTSDINILALFGKPLLAWSGGNPTVAGDIARANIVDVGAPSQYGAGGYFRSTDRQAPHNLFADTKKLFALEQFGQPPAKQVFQFRPASAPPPSTAKDVTGVRMNFQGIIAQFLWDPVTTTWHRSQALAFNKVQPQVDSKKVPVAPQNVVVMFCQYRPSPADAHSPEAQTIGTGTVWVFTAGKVIEGTWTRPTPTDALALTDSTGAPIALTPGQTWLELAEIGHAAEIPAGAAPDSVPFPRGG